MKDPGEPIAGERSRGDGGREGERGPLVDCRCWMLVFWASLFDCYCFSLSSFIRFHCRVSSQNFHFCLDWRKRRKRGEKLVAQSDGAIPGRSGGEEKKQLLSILVHVG